MADFVCQRLLCKRRMRLGNSEADCVTALDLRKGAEDKIKRILRNYVTEGLLNPDMEAFLQYVSDDLIGVGMGEQGIVRSKADMRRIMRTAGKDRPGSVYDLSFVEESVLFHSEMFATACAKILIRQTCGGEVSHSGLMQSICVKLAAGEWKICALHASPLLLSEESIEAYPIKFADHTLAQLRSDMQAEAFALMNQSLSGGIIGSYLVPGGVNPLYFINDSMLESLGYEREAFCRKFGKDLIGIVYEKDWAYILAKIEQAAQSERDVELRFRMLRQDGSVIWMLGRMRRMRSHEGRPALLAMFTDVTEMVHLQQRLEEQAEELSMQTEELSMQTEELQAQKAFLELQAQELTVSEERFRIAFERTSDVILDYDIIGGEITEFCNFSQRANRVTPIEALNAVSLSIGELAAESLAEFRHALAAMKDGRHQSVCVLRLRSAQGEDCWHRLSMKGVAAADGRNIRAIGVLEDITKQKEAEFARDREEQYRQAVLADAMATYAINFTKNIFESCEVRDRRCESAKVGAPYDASLQRIVKSRLCGDMRRHFWERFARANVLAAFERGEAELKLSYNVWNPDGTQMWMQNIMRLFVDNATNEKKGFLYVRDIDRQKREEIVLKRRSERDPLTDLYNKGTAEQRIEACLETLAGVQSGVFMIVDLDYFKQINDSFGHPFGDAVLADAAELLLDKFRDDDIVGRLGGDEFGAFFCGARSRGRVEELARSICRDMRKLSARLAAQTELSCSIGISCCDGRRKSFEQIYREADAALYRVKAAGRNGFAFYDGAPQNLSEEDCEKKR